MLAQLPVFYSSGMPIPLPPFRSPTGVATVLSCISMQANNLVVPECQKIPQFRIKGKHVWDLTVYMLGGGHAQPAAVIRYEYGSC
jgi:hypothetical protein